MAAYSDFLTLNAQGRFQLPGVGDTTTVSGNVVIDQDLTVNGIFKTVEQETLLVENAAIVLNQGYTTNAAKSGSLVVNYLPTATTAAVAAGGFASTSTVVVADGVTYSAGQFIMVSSAADSANDGIYEVASFNGGTDTITIDTTPVQGFSGNGFVVDTTVAGTVTVVTVAAMQAGTDGVWEVAAGSTAPLTFTDLLTAGSVTVAADNVTTGDAAAAFETTTGGITIGTLNNQALTLGSVGGNLTVNAAVLDINGSATTWDATTLSVDSTDTTNYTMTANAAGAKVLTIAAINSGSGEAQASITATDQLTVGDGVGTLVFDGGALSETGLTSFTMTPSGAVTLTAGAASTWSTSAGALTLTSAAAATWSTAAGALTLTSAAAATWSTAVGALTLTSAAAATWGTGAGILTLNGAGGVSIAGNAGEVDITTSGAVDINSGAATWDASTLSFDSTDTTNYTMTANAAGAKVLTIAAINSGSGEAQASITATDQLTVGDGVGTLVFDGGALSETGLTSFTMTPSGAVTLTAGAGSTWSTSAGALTLTSAAAATWSTAAGALTLTSAAAATWGTSSGGLTINGANGLLLQEAGTTRISITDAGAVGLNSASGQNVNVQVNGVSKFKVDAGSDSLQMGASARFTGVGANNTQFPASFSLVLTNNTGSTIAQGSLVAFSTTTGEIVLADNASGSAGANTRTAVGTTLVQIANTQSGPVAFGGIVPAKFAANPGTAAAVNGKPVYMGTGGLATMTSPTAAGSTRFQVGIAFGANNSDSTIRMLWRVGDSIDNP